AIRFAEVVFRTGALDGVLAVDVEDFIAFAPPAAVVILDTEHTAEQVSAAFGVEDQIRAFGRRRRLAVLSVEIELLRLRLVVGSIVDLDPVPARVLAFVRQRDPRGTGKRHGNETIARRPGGRRISHTAPPLVDAHQGRVDFLGETEADAE